LKQALAIGPWGLLGLLCLAFLLNYMDRQVVFAIFPILRKELGFTESQLGWAGSLFTWTYSAAMPFAGRIADVVPRHKLIIGSLVLWSGATIGTAFSRDVSEFLISRVAMGISESLYSPAAVALIASFHSSATRSRALAVHGLAQFAGITLGGWYGGWSADTMGWRNGLLLLTGIGFAYAIVLALFLRDSQARATAAVQEKRPAKPIDVVKSPSFQALSAAFFCFCAMLWMLYAWLPTFIYDHFHQSLAQSGLTATLYLQASSAVGAIIGGVLGDKFGKTNPIRRFWVLAFGLIMAAPFAFCIFDASSLLLLKISACCFGLCAGLFVSNIFASVYDVVASNNYGFAVGLINMLGGLGGGAAILITGKFKETIAISQLIAWATVASVLSGAVLIVVIRACFWRENQKLREAPALI
jgi:MFS family permease